ncbi:MAG: carboxylate--amine ligase [Eubacteriales bacterium]|nr:carboxylate--amine ligase [Eubacteriales bacterium]
MGTLMLLGGSQCQLNAARVAKSMGHRVVLADYLKHPPAADVCDEHLRVSTFDADACIRAAKQARVDGVFTTGTDQPVYTAARVAEALGLPTPISVETALKATNKRAMKAAFTRYGIPYAPFAFLKRGQSAAVLSGLETPLVIKPLDSQGQRGVFKVATAEEAVARLEETLSYSREDTALVESFYPSGEVTLSGYIHEGRVYPLTLTDRQLIADPVHIGVCAAHRYPSIFADREDEIYRIADRVALALGASEGPLYIQFLIGDNGVLVNEAACRVGGAFEDVFIPWLTGFDILRTVIRYAAGQPTDTSALGQPKRNGQVSVQMLFCRPGLVRSLTPLETLLSLPGALTAGYNYGIGSELAAMENATARFGYCVLATERGDMDELVRGLYRTLNVRDEAGRQLVLPRTYDGEDLPYV